MTHIAKLLFATTALMIMLLISCDRPGGHHRSDTARVDSAANEFYARIYSDPAGAEAGLKEFAASLPDSDSYHGVYAMIAITRLLQGDPAGSDSIIAELRRFIAANPGAAYSRERLLESRGVAYSLYGLNDLAIDDFRIATEECKRNGNWNMAVKNLANVGELVELQGDPSAAVGILRQALVLSDSTGHTEQDFSIRTRMGATYTSMGNYSEADRIFSTNEAVACQASPTDLFFYYSGLGNSLYYRKDYEKALRNFLLATTELPAIGDPYMDAVTHSNIGECFMYLNQLDSARYYIEKAVGEFEAIAVIDVNQRFYLNSLLGDLELRSGNIGLARKLLLSINPDTLSVTPRYAAIHHHRLQHFYASEGDYRRSLQHLLKANAIDDSITSSIARNYSAEVENRYLQDTTILHTRLRMAQKDEKISYLYMWISGGVAVACIIIFGLIIYNVIRRRRAAREFERMRNSILSMRIENARNRISPHFVFNMLNDELPVENVNIRNLVKLLRLNLELCNRPTVTLEEEVRFIDLYVKVIRSSLGSGFTYRRDIEPGLDLSVIRMPAMIVQIFIENAVKHGLMGYEDPHKELTLSIRHDAGNIVITVGNTAPAGHRPHAPGTGTGLRVVTQTISALNAANTEQIGLSQKVDNLPDGRTFYTVTLTLPLDFNYTLGK